MADDGLILEAKIRAKFDEATLRTESQKAGGLMARILESNFSKGLLGGALGRNFEARTSGGQTGLRIGQVVTGLALLGTAVFFLKKIFGAILDSSGFLRSTLGLFGTSLRLILMVLGNIVAKYLLPIGKFMLGLSAYFVRVTGGGLPSGGGGTTPPADFNPEHPSNVLDYVVKAGTWNQISDQLIKTSKESILESYRPSKFSSFWDFLVDFIKVVFRGSVGRIAEAVLPSAGAMETTTPSNPYAGLSGLDLLNAPGSEAISFKTGAASVASKSQVDQILAHYNDVFKALTGNVMSEAFANLLASGATGGGITGDQALKIWQTTGNTPAGTLWSDPWVKANLGHFMTSSGYGLSDPAQLAAQAVNLQRPGFFSFLQDILPVAARVGSTVSPLLASIIGGAQSLGGNLANVPLDLGFPGGSAGALLKFWNPPNAYADFRESSAFTSGLYGVTPYQSAPFSGIDIGAGGTVTVKVYIGTTELRDLVRTEIEQSNFLANTAVS